MIVHILRYDQDLLQERPLVMFCGAVLHMDSETAEITEAGSDLCTLTHRKAATCEDCRAASALYLSRQNIYPSEKEMWK
jgi:hypothetical protein